MHKKWPSAAATKLVQRTIANQTIVKLTNPIL
jgi:hypothetical protein